MKLNPVSGTIGDPLPFPNVSFSITRSLPLRPSMSLSPHILADRMIGGGAVLRPYIGGSMLCGTKQRNGRHMRKRKLHVNTSCGSLSKFVAVTPKSAINSEPPMFPKPCDWPWDYRSNMKRPVLSRSAAAFDVWGVPRGRRWQPTLSEQTLSLRIQRGKDCCKVP